ncbi:uncharacterized protein LOC116295256, partial [Actinia tenebrosa]|uniref:Uncharacterized protein LOC116295256 n=1 Tax=Actinia tenebrosa TaxID=6105 RepID=A0A6P8HUG1_ACTTE
MEQRTKRTCVKCRFHGKVVPLKDHKSNCPYKLCSCEQCSTHDKSKEGKRLANQPQTTNASCTQTVLDVAEVDLSSKVVAKNMSVTAKKTEQKKKQLEKHRELYAKVNEFSKDISSAVPDMNPLQVMKTALQLHQSGLSTAKPKARSKEREAWQAMPDLPIPSARKSYILEEDKLDHLYGAFPDVSRSTLASLLIHEKGDINRVITSWMVSDEESSTESSVADVFMNEELAVADIATKTSISKQELNSILDNVKNQELGTGANILSFHSREARQQAPSVTCTGFTSKHGNDNTFSRALSSQTDND